MKQVISAHPIIGLERTVVIDNINLSYTDEFLIIHLHTNYIKDNEVVENLKLQDVEYIVISDNRTTVKIKDGEFKQIDMLEEDVLKYSDYATGFTLADLLSIITKLDSQKAFD